jgi:type I restriction enzyme M protein
LKRCIAFRRFDVMTHDQSWIRTRLAKATLQEQLRALKVEQQTHEQAAKAAQSEGDALYWPIYNLDLKNPNTRTTLDHADPQDLLASMRSHEGEVMRLLGEIEALVCAGN